MLVHFEKCNDCCVWMDAGVLSYKRCERNFDCEHCPLDQVLQTEVPLASRTSGNHYEQISVPIPDSAGEAATALLSPYCETVLHSDFHYAPGHIWVQPLAGGYYRLGLDALSLALLPDLTDIIAMASGSQIEENGPFGWLYINGKTHPMRSPVPGTVIRRNGNIGRVTDDLRADAYDKSWIAVVKGTDPEAGLPTSMQSAEVYTETIQSTMTAFVQKALQVCSANEHLGLCMNDGGIPVPSLATALGSDAYTEIIYDVLGFNVE